MISYSKLRGRIFNKKAKTLSSLIFDYHQKHSLKREINSLEAKYIIKDIFNSLDLKHFDYLNEVDDLVKFLIDVKRNEVDINLLDFTQEKKDDLLNILNAYNQFLDKHNLADIADIEKWVFENIDEKYEVDEFENENLHFFDSKLQKKIYDKIKNQVLKEEFLEESEIKTIECFDEFDEVVKTFKIIKSLLDNGIKENEIKIIVTDIDKYFKIFETLAYEYKIPVFSTKGVELKRYEKGRIYATQKAKHLKEKLKKLNINIPLEDIKKDILNERILVKNGIEITETNQVYVYKDINYLFLVGANIDTFPPTREKHIFYTKDYEKLFFKNNLYKSSYDIIKRIKKIAKNIIAFYKKDNLTILIEQNPYNFDFKYTSKKENLSTPYENIPIKYNKTSVSQINTYNNCPKEYFYKYILKLSPPKENEEMDIMLRGEIMHKAFEIAVSKKIFDIDTLINRAYEDKEIKDKLIHNIYEEIYKKELIPILQNFIEDISKRDLTNSEVEKTIYLDKNLNIQEDEGFFVGKIDRIDINDEITIIDYKSSSSKTYKDFLIQDNKIKDIQLGLYMYWAKQKYKKPTNASLMTFKKEIKEFVKIKECQGDVEKQGRSIKNLCYNQDYENRLKTQIFDTIKNIENGKFDYSDSPNCEYCNYVKICKG